MSPLSFSVAVHIVVCTCMVLLYVSGVSPLDLLQQWPGNIKSTSICTHHLFPLVCWYLVQYLSDIIHCHSGVWGDRVMCSNTLIIMTSAMEEISLWGEPLEVWSCVMLISWLNKLSSVDKINNYDTRSFHCVKLVKHDNIQFLHNFVTRQINEMQG